MKLSTRSRYGLRLMFELAVNGGNGPVFLKDIAKRQDISEKYLSKLVIPLRGAMLVTSARGVHGGYTLSRAPATITVKEIVETLEGDVTQAESPRREGAYRITSDYPTRSLWCKLDEAIAKVLTENTLQTLVDEYAESRLTGTISFEI